MSESGISEAKLLIELANLAKKQGWFDKLINTFKNKHTILVLGCTGVGKTNLVDSLSEAAPKAVDHMLRTEYSYRRRLKISEEIFNFIDTPGDISRKPNRIRAIRRSMSRGIAGVINVVANGYHEGRLGKKEALTRDGNPRQSFLKKCVSGN